MRREEVKRKLRKKLLLVAVCLVVLSVVAGIYAYNAINSSSNIKTFVFAWSSKEQQLVDGTLRMELTFSVDEENLSIIAKINDANFSDHPPVNGINISVYYPMLVLVFDMDQSGKIEIDEPCYVFHSDNWCRSPSLKRNAWWDGYGGCIIACMPDPSPYHTCTIDESGVTFNISIPREELDLVNDLVIVSYLGVWKQFNFGLEV